MAKNEYGAQLDRNGYAPSIMQPERRGRFCYLCGLPAGHEKMDRHEPYGAALRQKSKELGLWVDLHHWGCHEGPGSAHGSGEVARQLRKDAQVAAMLRYGWSLERWIKEFGKSELTAEEAEALTQPAAPTVRRIYTTAQSGAGSTARAFHAEPVERVSGFRLLDGPDLPF